MAQASVQSAGGVRKGKGAVKTIFPPQLEFLVEFYDRHIERIEGYQPNDPAKVDALHKKEAVGLLMGNAAGGL